MNTEQEVLISDEDAAFLGVVKPERSEPQPTERQLSYAHSLLRERQPFGNAKDAEDSNGPEAAHEHVNGMTKKDISLFISKMLLQPKRVTSARTTAAQVEAGVYQMDGVVYKVKRAVHGSGHLYALRLEEEASNGVGYMTWVSAPGVVNRLRPGHKMSIEDAASYGRLYGVCIACGRTLTDEESISAGIGPICRSKW